MYAPGFVYGAVPVGFAGPAVPMLPSPKQVAKAQHDARLQYSMMTCTNVITLYHQTDAESARAILRSGKMLRGKSGAAGGGIYFATSPQATMLKAHKNGVILVCQVVLGNCALMVKGWNMRPTDYDQLISRGVDSIRITGMPTGDEFVVYNYGQVRVLYAMPTQ